MKDKVSLKNPKDQNFEVHQNKVFNLLEKAAQKMFSDKTFHNEFKGVFFFSTILKVLSSTVSFITGFIAVQIAINLLFGFYLSASIAFMVCLCLEFLKAFFWSINSKWILKYKRFSKPIFSVLVVLHLSSLGLSAYGGFMLPKMATIEKQKEIAPPNLDSINAPYLAAIAKIDVQAERTSQKAAGITSNSTIKSLNGVSKTLLEQKKEQTRLKNRANLEAKAKHKEKQAKSNKEYKERQKEHDNDIKVARISCLVASIFFEVLFIVCSMFNVYYLFRLNIEIEAKQTAETTADSSPSTRQEENAETSPKQPINVDVSPSKRQTAAAEEKKAKPIGFFTGQELEDAEELSKKLNVQKCSLDTCSNSFLPIVHNKKYCSDECKKLAYQKRRYSKTTKK